jgi:probable F420-dependent oxidoreductase
MDLGLFILQTDRTIAPDVLAREAEARGFESLFFAEHTHIPISRESPFPGGGELPDPYRRTLDPFVALAVAGQATTRLRLGTGVCLPAQHDPITLAKQIATLDHLTRGRVLLGIGFGWNLEEARDHGVDVGQRRAIAREKVLAMRALWSEEVASFEGEHVHVSESWAWPKPVQVGGPPVLLGGGATPAVFRHIVEYGDGWMPIGGSGLRDDVEALARLARERGRDPSSISVTVFGTSADRRKLDHYADLGVDRAVIMLPSADPDRVLRALDRAGAMVGR